MGITNARICGALLVAAMFLLLLPATALADTWDGTTADASWHTSDESATEFTISDAADLAGLAQLVNAGNNFSGKTVKLAADIDLGGKEWTPIGDSLGTGGKYFQGTFDGQGHSIAGLAIARTYANSDYTYSAYGLFGAAGGGAEFKDLSIVSPRIGLDQAKNVGALLGGVGYSGNSGSVVISNVEVTGADISANARVGGIVGWVIDSTKGVIISDCSVTGNISAVYNTTENDDGDKAGGIAGQVSSASAIVNCSYSDGIVSAYREAAGIVGTYAGGDQVLAGCEVADVTVVQDINSATASEARCGQLVGRLEASAGATFDIAVVNNEFSNVTWNATNTPDEHGIGTSTGEGTSTVKTSVAAIVDNASYDTLAAAIAALQDGSVMTIMPGKYEVTATRTEGTYGSCFIIDENNVTIKAADPDNKPVVYGFTNKYSAGTDDGNINGQDTIYVSGKKVTLENLVIMPLGGYKDNGGTGNTFATKTVEVTSTAAGFKMTGCETTPNTNMKDDAPLDNAEMTKSGNIHVSINDATISNNSFGTGTTISAGWVSDSAANTYTVDVSNNYWGKDATATTIANAVDGNVTVNEYFTNADMTETATIGGIPVATVKQLEAAITSAKNDDTIIVAPGIYGGNITFGGKSLTIKAQYPAYQDGVKETVDAKLSKFTGTFNTYGDDASSFNAGQTVVIEGFAFSGNGLKVGNTNYNSVGNLEVRHCTMECGGNLGTQDKHNMYNYFVKISGNAGEPYASVVVEDNYVFGTLVTDPFAITPIQLWDVKSAVARNNVIDVADCVDAQGINVSMMEEDAVVVITDNEISGVGGGIYVTTWKLGGEAGNATAVFNGTVTVEDNELNCAASEEMNPIFFGYEEAAGDGNPYGLLAGTQTVTGNTNNGEAIDAVIVREPASQETELITATFKDGESVVATVSGEPNEDGELEVMTPAAPTKSGYTFKGWSDGESIHGAGVSVTIGANATFAAVWSANSTPAPVPTPEQHAVSVGDFPNGKVSADPAKAEEGDKVTLTVAPDAGYELEAIAVVGPDGEEVELTANADGTYSFEMPGFDVEVEASFACDGGELCPSHGFADVDQDEWYHDAIDWAVANKVLNGFDGTGLMMPDGEVTRAQMAQILWNVEGRPAVAEDPGFSDVADSDWFDGAVAWAASEGIFEGYDGTDSFGPDDVLTREQAAAVLMRWTEANGGDVDARADLSGYPDASSVDGWAVEYVSWAVASGVISGVEQEDGTLLLDPAGTATRAQTAMLMMRLIEA